MFEKLIELRQHLLTYFPDAYIRLSIIDTTISGCSETEFKLDFRLKYQVDKSSSFTSYTDLVSHIQRLIFAECAVMNRKIEESNGYLKMRNLN